MKIKNTDLTTNDPIYACPLCSFFDYTPGKLSSHVKKKHPEHYFPNR